MADLIEDLKDLHRQATEERSHYYVGSIVKRSIAELERLRAALFKIQTEELRVASSTDMTRPAMREAAMDTRNEIIEILKHRG